MRTTYDASRTVTASANGRLHGVGPTTDRNSSPTAQPSSVLIRRLQNILSPRFTTGSLDATIDAIAQIGLASVKNRRMNQTTIDAMKTFTANRTPRRWSSCKRSRTLIARGLTFVVA